MSTKNDPGASRSERLRALHNLLGFEKDTQIVDIGANPIDGAPPYTPLLDAGLCFLTGFEPEPSALAALNAASTDREKYLPYAIGDGSSKTLHSCRYSGWTSTLRPNEAALNVFPVFKQNAEVIATSTIETRRLDDIEEVDQIDYLKIDIQGGELDVFRNAVRKLERTAVIHTEVSFVGLYEGQPAFGAIDVELRKQGFVLHSFADLKNCMISPLVMTNDPWITLNQVLEADVVYVRDFRYPDKISDDQLRHMCLVADACYRSYDLALNCLHELKERGAVLSTAVDSYLSLINEAP